MKLYRVRCRGMTDSHGTAYVVAKDAGAAYAMLRASLDRRDLGFSRDREMDRVELVAEVGAYPGCGCALYLPRHGGEENR